MRNTILVAAAVAVVTSAGVYVCTSHLESRVAERAARPGSVPPVRDVPTREQHERPARQPGEVVFAPATVAPLAPAPLPPAVADPPEVLRIENLDPRFVEAMSKELQLSKLLIRPTPEAHREEEAEPAQTVVSAFGTGTKTDGTVAPVRWMPRCGEGAPRPMPRMPYADDADAERDRLPSGFPCPLPRDVRLPDCPAEDGDRTPRLPRSGDDGEEQR